MRTEVGNKLGKKRIHLILSMSIKSKRLDCLGKKIDGKDAPSILDPFCVWLYCICIVHLFLMYVSSFSPRDEVQLKTYSKSNGQPKSIGSASPGAGQPTLSSPTRGGVKKVSGVGGTTYEISV